MEQSNHDVRPSLAKDPALLQPVGAAGPDPVGPDPAAPYGGVPFSDVPLGDVHLPPTTPVASKRFRLVRSRTDRMLGGVCGGIAESLGVDAALVRIGLVALTLLGVGAGAIVYVAIWALAPESDLAAAQ